MPSQYCILYQSKEICKYARSANIAIYSPVHKFWPKTSWAGNQGYHQNFDPSLLKVAFFQKVQFVFQTSKSPKKVTPNYYPELEI